LDGNQEKIIAKNLGVIKTKKQTPLRKAKMLCEGAFLFFMDAVKPNFCEAEVRIRLSAVAESRLETW
jgi:hypothetical protein